MSDEKKTTTITDAAAQAEQLEKEAQAQKGLYTYTHVFQEPFTYQGMTYEKLTFNWKTRTACGTRRRTSRPPAPAPSTPPWRARLPTGRTTTPIWRPWAIAAPILRD